MFNSYVIEAQNGVAGIVVRDNGQFRFFASHRRFNALEGQYFASPHAAEKAVVRQATLRRDEKSRKA